MRLCSRCKTNPARNGQYSCASCHNEYQKEYYKKNPRSINESAKRRKKEIRELIIAAKNVPCADCGNEYPYYVMDLDHVRGEKRLNLSVAASKWRSLKAVQEEIDKCDPVCANCHRIRTFDPRHSVLVSEHSL